MKHKFTLEEQDRGGFYALIGAPPEHYAEIGQKGGRAGRSANNASQEHMQKMRQRKAELLAKGRARKSDGG